MLPIRADRVKHLRKDVDVADVIIDECTNCGSWIGHAGHYDGIAGPAGIYCDESCAADHQNQLANRTATDCIFCEIIAQAAPATIRCRWPDAIAFVPLNPVTKGHLLVVPRVHVESATSSPWISGRMMIRAAQLARTYPASNILTSDGAAATQTIFHLHIHVVPRAPRDQLMLPWGTTGDPHAPHRCKRIDQLEAELSEMHMRHLVVSEFTDVKRD